ncbi:MAG TPA: hypothetical protein VHG09_02140 [Longimicrobiales bacterium]|nr:hypothetical protein [Longimicrobiales bacterium]
MRFAHAPHELRAYAHAMIHSAVLWDVLGTLRLLPPWWPPISYVLAGAGIAAACLSALFLMLGRRAAVPPVRGAVSTSPDSDAPARDRPGRAGVGAQLLAIAILLGAWLLRGHAEIPPDMPLVAAEAVAAALYAVTALRTRNSRGAQPT